MSKARWRKIGRTWQRETTEVYDAPLELVWLLHANHMAPFVLENAGCDFEGPGSAHTNGAMATGQKCTVHSGPAGGKYDYVVAKVDPSAHSVELVETRGLLRRWRRRFELEKTPDGTAVTERLLIERGLPLSFERPIVERLAARRTAAIHRWLGMSDSERPAFPKNAKAPMQRRN